MIRALAVCIVLAATAHSASAGVYGSLGLGNTAVDDSSNAFSATSRSLRFAAGYQFTPFVGVEGGVIGYDLSRGADPYDGREFYVAGVGHLPFSDGFGAFGRLGFQHTGFSDNNGNDLSATGYLIGAGFEYKLPIHVPSIAGASVWVDYTRNGQGLKNDAGQALNPTGRSIGQSMWTLGVTVGL
jgi:hypothetical protein